MKTKHSVWKSKLAKTMLLLTAVLVAALFLGTAASAGLQSKVTQTQKQDVKVTKATADGLAPKASKITQYQPQATLGGRGYFYAFCAYDPSGAIPIGPITFDTPDAIESLGAGINPGFMAGGDIDDLGNWYGVDYYGGIYLTALDGTMTYVAPSIAMNGLTFDLATLTWYGSGGNNLYTVDVTTGATTLVGSHGVANTIIGIACDKDGNMYGYDVLFSGMSSLYSINTATGVATVIGSMGVGFLYAQDPAYDRDNSILYLAGYTQSGTSGLYTCDVTTGAVTLIGGFAGGMEVDGFAIPWIPFVFDHDIGITGITKPATGNAAAITPIVKVKNTGLYTETNVDIKLDIGKQVISGDFEDFEATDGGYTHYAKGTGLDAWQWGTPTSGPMAAHSGSKLWATNLAGPYPTSMWCSLVTTPFTVTAGFQFKFWHWYQFESGWDGGNVKISPDGGATWTLITPVGGYPGVMSSNPYMNGQAGYTGTGGNSWNQAVFDLSAYEGMLVQIMWETASDSSVTYPGWYIDDIGDVIVSWQNVYSNTVNIPSIAPDETIELSFPEWTPADLGLVENVNINYFAEATNLFADENILNDYKAKPFSLSYGYFNDVQVNAIGSPVSGLANPQTPNATIENVGQFDQSANVNMVISKISYGSQWQVWNPSGGNTWVRDTLGPRTGTACAKCTYEYTGLLNDDWLATPGNVVAPGGVFSFWVQGYTYNDDTYHVYMSTTGNTIDDFLAGTELYSGIAPTSYTLQSFDLSAYVGQTVYCGIFYDGNYAWYIWVDDVTLPDGGFEGFEGTNFPPMLVSLSPEYDQTVTVDIAAGETITVDLPLWTPADLPFAMGIDYQADVEVTLNGFTPIYNYGFEDWAAAFPPAGWAIYDVNGGGSWFQSTTGQHSGVACAKVSYNYPAPNDDWFVTPGTVVAPGGVFDLWVNSYYSYDTYQIYMSTTGNTVADFLAGTLLADVTSAPTVYTEYTFDMSAYVGQTVWFAVYSNAYDWLYVWVDDVTLPDGSFEGFENTAAGWPGWTIINYGVPNQWFSVNSGSYPTCVPPEGSSMAEYNSWNVASGNAADLLQTGATVDFTSATQMKFKMMHNTGYNAADVIYPLLSLDGINWWYDGTGFYQYDGTNGWKTETMDYSLLINYLGGPGNYYIGFEAVSSYGYNMFIDDLSVSVFSSIPDGNPGNNMMSKTVTLSYEHDVGVAAITEPSAPGKAGEVIFHQGYWGVDESWAFNNAGVGSGTVYLIQEDFYGLADPIGDVSWWGLPLVYAGGWSEGSPDMLFDIIFYEDNAGAPGAVVATFIGLDPDFEDTGLDYIGFSQMKWSVTLPESVELTTGWISIQSELPADLANLMWATGPDGNNNCLQNGANLAQNCAYDLGKAEGGEPGGAWLPGTYQVAGIVKNLGVTYDETGFDVNTQITNATGVVVYDYTVTVADILAPGGTAAVTFPDITIENTSAAEGVYKVTMKTMLVGDDHANNDKKTMNFEIQRLDITAPITTATLAGTMGQANWYISTVTVTLSAVDPAGPGKFISGVKNVYYKVDTAADWTIYTTPIEVSTDGPHTVYYYADDNAGNVETEKSVSFKIDKTAPTITITATAQNLLKTKWLLVAEVSDDQSGVVKVEFYVADALVGTVNATPWEFLYQGTDNPAQGIAYDAAGNSAISIAVDVYAYEVQSQQSTPLTQMLLKNL